MGLKRIAAIVTTVPFSSGYPEDARSLARMHLQDLDNGITALLGKADLKLDDYSRAHLADSQSRIRRRWIS